jgi:signal transduction histidine kinase
LAAGAVLMTTLRDYYVQRELSYSTRQAHAAGILISRLYNLGIPAERIGDSFPYLALSAQARVQLYDTSGQLIVDSGLPDEQQFDLMFMTADSPTMAEDQVAAEMIPFPPLFSIRAAPPPDEDMQSWVFRLDEDVNVPIGGFGFGIDDNVSLDGVRSDQQAQAEIVDSNNETRGYVMVSQGPAYGRAILHSVFNGWLIASTFAVLLAAGAGWIVSRRITAPLLALTDVTGRMAKGDLSARARVMGRDEVGFLASSFNEMASRVEETVQTLRRFIADAAHEIHTPLTAVNTNLELAASESNDNARLTFLKRAQEQLKRLETLTTNLLNLSRLETSTSRDEPVRVDIALLAQETSELYASQAEQAGIVFQFDLPEEQIVVYASEAQLRCALENLLENALKFTPEQGTITLGVRREGEQVKLWVKDTGIGIPPDDLPHIFSRFHRGRNAAAYPGSGLGLAIIKAIAERHQGQVKVESKLGQGTYFALQLPA